MTNEEAIIVLKYGMKYRNPKNDTEKDRNEALDMAISALSEQKSPKERMEQLYLVESLKEDFENLIKENERLRNALSENKEESRPKGEWDVNCQGIVFCSKCKKVINHNYDIDYMESHFNFCPNCGADMRGE